MRQPLAAIITNGSACLRWLARARPELDVGASLRERMIDDARRASEVVIGLRALFKKTDAEGVRLDLDEVVGEIVRWFNARCLPIASLCGSSSRAQLPPVLGDRSSLSR